MENVNILICSGGKRTDLIKEFQRALGGRGRVVITDANDLNAGRFFADAFFKAPRLTDKGYLPFIKKIIKKSTGTEMTLKANSDFFTKYINFESPNISCLDKSCSQN